VRPLPPADDLAPSPWDGAAGKVALAAIGIGGIVALGGSISLLAGAIDAGGLVPIVISGGVIALCGFFIAALAWMGNSRRGPVGQADRWRSIDARLEHLSKLRDGGLISLEDYDRRKAEILRDV
jgi:hypothetical protein